MLCVDLGSTSVKVALINTDEASRVSIIATSTQRYPPSCRTKMAQGEVDPSCWAEMVVKGLDAIMTQEPHCKPTKICVSGLMQTLMMLGHTDGDAALGLLPIAPCLLYSDSRAIDEAASIPPDLSSTLLSFKGPSSLPAKLLWVMKHHPDAARQCRQVLLGAADYLIHWLTGECVTDVTNASTTGLLSVHEMEKVWRGQNDAGGEALWAKEVLLRTGVAEGLVEALPRIAAAGEVVGAVTVGGKSVANVDGADRVLQWIRGAQVYHAGGDVASITHGALSFAPTPTSNTQPASVCPTYLYLGTSGWAATLLPPGSSPPAATEGIFTLAYHYDPSRVVLAAPMLTAGGNFEWLEGLQIGAGVGKGMEAMASEGRVGGGGVLWLPHLKGERSPDNCPNASGAFIGVTASTSPADLCRAVHEGVAFQAARLIRHLEKYMPSVVDVSSSQPVVVVGGCANSSLLAQTLSTALNRSVMVPCEPSLVGLAGAAMAETQGLADGVTYEPCVSEAGAFCELMCVYEKASDALRPVCEGLADWRRQHMCL
ncbi:unnamed protein product [Vitrella brassicaformis CCMP3155]|uniref:Glycerol kinase n=1 Tax=Vitrella brassicaformis (strain CCMP3155) TaxID=1169540 RepID=A0A0G4EIG8_VITBC|nr:unnamed protein product [Vitrella brassicaformis CCMP3155]|eukprot:CEL96793.1 unnamed protein product [Vitrella brassicaformis CCMP3155]